MTKTRIEILKDIKFYTEEIASSEKYMYNDLIHLRLNKRTLKRYRNLLKKAIANLKDLDAGT